MKRSLEFLLNESRFLFFGFFVALMSSFGQTYFIGVFRAPIAEEFALSDSAFGALYLVVTIGSAVGLNRLGHLIDKVPLQRYVFWVFVCLVLAVFAVSLTSGIASVLLALLFVRLMGQGLLTHMAMTSMSRYYAAERGRAVAFAALGMPVGQALFPPLAVYLMMDMSWRDTWAVFAVVIVGMAVPALIIALKGHSDRHKAWHEETTKNNTARKNGGDKRRRDVVRDMRFYLMLPALMAAPFWVTAVFFYADVIAASKALSMQAYANLYWTFSAGAVIVPFIGGALVDRFGGVRLLPFYPPVLALALLMGIYASGTVTLSLYMALLGIAGGIAVPINNAMWAEMYGTRYLGEIKALATSLLVFSTALAPYLLGIFLDEGVHINQLLMGGIIITLLSTGLSAIAVKKTL